MLSELQRKMLFIYRTESIWMICCCSPSRRSSTWYSRAYDTWVTHLYNKLVYLRRRSFTWPALNSTTITLLHLMNFNWLFSVFPSLQCHQQPICRSLVFTVPKSPTSAVPCRKYLNLGRYPSIDRTHDSLY